MYMYNQMIRRREIRNRKPIIEEAFTPGANFWQNGGRGVGIICET